jgi:hypothetical protein
MVIAGAGQGRLISFEGFPRYGTVFTQVLAEVWSMLKSERGNLDSPWWDVGGGKEHGR